MPPQTSDETQKLVMTRSFAFPPETVYRAWTEPDRMVRWFSPNVRWNSPTIDVEPVPGGKHNITMNHSDGDRVHWIGSYVELVPYERLAFTLKWLEDTDDPGESLVTVVLRPVPEGTELTLTHDNLRSARAMEGVSSGWDGCLAMLGEYLGGAVLFDK